MAGKSKGPVVESLAVLRPVERVWSALTSPRDLGLLVLGRVDARAEPGEFRLDRFVYVKTAAGVDLEQARVAITAVTDAYPSAAVTDTEELIGDLESQIDGLLNLLVVLLAFAIIIALLGIVNTLALSISERKREIGLLRAVGMQRRQVRRMVRWEAVLIALFGGVLGLAVGLALGIALVVAVGEGLRLTIPGGQLFTYLIAAGLGGVLAAAIPARRGAKLDILDAIAYE